MTAGLTVEGFTQGVVDNLYDVANYACVIEMALDALGSRYEHRPAVADDIGSIRALTCSLRSLAFSSISIAEDGSRQIRREVKK